MRGKTGRSDYLPSREHQAAMLGYSGISVSWVLANEVRRLNVLFERLAPEEQSVLVDDWSESFDRLRRDLQDADDRASLAAITAWSQSWRKRLNFSYAADKSFTYNKNKEQRK